MAKFQRKFFVLMSMVIACTTGVSLAASALEPAPGFRDPTRPQWQAPARASAQSAATAAAKKPARLDGIVFASDRRVAIIGGRPYVRGDFVQGLRITEIRAGQISLRGENGEQIWRLQTPTPVRSNKQDNSAKDAVQHSSFVPDFVPDAAPAATPASTLKLREKAAQK